MIRLADRVQNLRPSPTLEISAKAAELKRQGLDVISLAAGEPDYNTPEVIQNAATEAMAKGLTRYTPAAGFMALREAIAQKATAEKGFKVAPDEVIITSGAKHALYLALQTLAQAGDTVLIPTPAWVSYGPMIELAGANIFPLPLHEEDNYQVNVDRWRGMAIPPTAKGIILNSPNNPTGAVYSKEDLIKVAGWALQRGLWIISDEVYEDILYDGVEHTPIASLGPEIRSDTITISSFSKTYSMTGWRVGWSIADPEITKKMSSIASQSTSNPTSFAQWGALAAIEIPREDVQRNISVFEGRRRYCMERLDALKDHLTYAVPKGAFYFFVNLSKYLEKKKQSDTDFCKQFLTEHQVGLVPGSAFGRDNSFRLSYATSDSNLVKAFDRLEAFLSR